MTLQLAAKHAQPIGAPGTRVCSALVDSCAQILLVQQRALFPAARLDHLLNHSHSRRSPACRVHHFMQIEAAQRAAQSTAMHSRPHSSFSFNVAGFAIMFMTCPASLADPACPVSMIWATPPSI